MSSKPKWEPHRKKVKDLAREVVETYGLSERVSVSAQGADIRTGPDRGTPLSLIVTELVANACKHAFPDGGRGSILLTGAADGGWYVLTVVLTHHRL